MPNENNTTTVVTLTQDKETKNTVRFTTPDDAPISGSLYVKKDDERSKNPTLTVTVG